MIRLVSNQGRRLVYPALDPAQTPFNWTGGSSGTMLGELGKLTAAQKQEKRDKATASKVSKLVARVSTTPAGSLVAKGKVSGALSKYAGKESAGVKSLLTPAQQYVLDKAKAGQITGARGAALKESTAATADAARRAEDTAAAAEAERRRYLDSLYQSPQSPGGSSGGGGGSNIPGLDANGVPIGLLPGGGAQPTAYDPTGGTNPFAPPTPDQIRAAAAQQQAEEAAKAAGGVDPATGLPFNVAPAAKAGFDLSSLLSNKWVMLGGAAVLGAVLLSRRKR